jgi:hypothetical protein
MNWFVEIKDGRSWWIRGEYSNETAARRRFDELLADAHPHWRRARIRKAKDSHADGTIIDKRDLPQSAA